MPGTALKCVVSGPVVQEMHIQLAQAPQAGSYVRINSTLSSLGGSGAFAALTLAAQRVEVLLLAPKASDEYAVGAEALFSSRGIDWQATKQLLKTPLFYSLYDPVGERWVLNEQCLFESDSFPDELQSDFVMLYPTAAKDALSTANLAQDKSIPLIFCPSASLKPFRWAFIEIAGKASWVILNTEEARYYTDSLEIEDAIATLLSLCPNLIITQGPSGALLCCGGTQLFIPTVPVQSYLTAGDGDIAAAVYCTGLFGCKLSPAQALNAAQEVVTRYLRRGSIPLESPIVFDLLNR